MNNSDVSACSEGPRLESERDRPRLPVHVSEDEAEIEPRLNSTIVRRGKWYGTFVTVKSINPDLDRSTLHNLLGKLNREVAIHSGLVNPNVCQFLGVATVGHAPALVFSPFDSTLKDRIGKAEQYLLLSYFAGAVAGVRYIHWRGLVHCDLTPISIVITNGVAKVRDLGAVRSKDTDTAKCHEPIQTSISLFTAPEARGNPKSCHTSQDVFSLGLILECLLSGNEDPIDILQVEDGDLVHQAGADYRSSNAAVRIEGGDVFLKDVFLACVSCEPNRRPTAAMLQDKIKETLASQKQGSTTHVQPVVLPAQPTSLQVQTSSLQRNPSSEHSLVFSGHVQLSDHPREGTVAGLQLDCDSTTDHADCEDNCEGDSGVTGATPREPISGRNASAPASPYPNSTVTAPGRPEKNRSHPEQLPAAHRPQSRRLDKKKSGDQSEGASTEKKEAEEKDKRSREEGQRYVLETVMKDPEMCLSGFTPLPGGGNVNFTRQESSPVAASSATSPCKDCAGRQTQSREEPSENDDEKERRRKDHRQ
eukprot:scpid33451/ scgid1305/ Probable serine/threonine-protein kinase CPE1738